MGADYLNPQILEQMTRDETMQKLCIIMGEAQDHLGWDHAADCFCFKSQFSESDYRNDGKSVEFIEAAVREKIKREIKQMTHTPGPWTADGYHVRQSGINGTRMIADVCYTGRHHTPPNEYPISCRLMDESNAQLMAAAPELLEALEMLLTIEPNHFSADAYERSLWENARETIAKAIGKK